MGNELICALLVLVSTFSCVLSLKHKTTPCTPVGPCQCQFPDGQGIDLSPLRNASLGWFSNKTITNDSIRITPCGSGFANASSECTNASVCLALKNFTEYVNLGSPKDGKVVQETITQEAYLVYSVNKTTTKVYLVCDHSKSTPIVSFLSAKNDKYEMKFESKEACLKDGVGKVGPSHEGLGIFSVLLLIALVLLLAYFILGILVLRCIRGAEGVEMIPNHQFWLSLPNRIKDQVIFLVNGCRDPTPYDRI